MSVVFNEEIQRKLREIVNPNPKPKNERSSFYLHPWSHAEWDTSFDDLLKDVETYEQYLRSELKETDDYNYAKELVHEISTIELGWKVFIWEETRDDRDDYGE